MRERVEDSVKDALRFLAWAPVVRTSATTRRGVTKVMPAVDRALASWNTRVPTAELNAWLREATPGVPLHRARGGDIKIRYATQAGIRPPEIVLFTTGRVSDAAKRALERRFRDRFDVEGSPVKIVDRAREPRYAKRP
jgi:GTP-binding protein